MYVLPKASLGASIKLPVGPKLPALLIRPLRRFSSETCVWPVSGEKSSTTSCAGLKGELLCCCCCSEAVLIAVLQAVQRSLLPSLANRE